MDEDVHMDTMLHHLGQPPMMDMPQPTEQQLGGVPMDEDVHMEIMSKHLRQPLMMDGPQPIHVPLVEQPMENDDMVGT
jgi:hypothetical protein